MKRIASLIVLSTYVIWAVSCSEHKQNEQEHNHEEHAHEESDEHAHAEQNEAEHNHEAVDKDIHDEHDIMYGIIQIKPQNFQEVIHTSGKIMPAQGDEQTLTAIHDGVVVFGSKSLLSGQKVSKSENLLTISGKGLIHDNIETTFRDSKSAFETTQSNYERARILNKDKITSDKDLADIEMAYQKAKNNFEMVKQNYSSGGQQVAALTSGFIKDIFVTEGQFVNTGQPLLKITQNKRLVVKADVPQRFFPTLKEIRSANFITVYDQQLYHTETLNGNLISFGKSTLENSLFTPIYFEIDNVGSLLAGSFIEIYLKTAVIANCIVIPKTAILEEAGRHYVFVEGEHEEFEKRFVTIDCHDGENYHITEGLAAGEHVVTKNPYQLKLASLSGVLPAHSHQH